ncbi:protein unc-93 homolog A-like [Phascolarctos cinereus]|uniref:Protein unc-93 homolog A n=1 Tax=Phascolarctos cinereus TaxID=38626 RepID=A0A6P5IV98_PHACI|nr:protein unc-93 homolog A-like [Phascolarctos cinereus]XP_020826078.1 protein unc-93 homolog A-like [Phascolarctos cinereus]XP_020826080.1 protein unc-93 homolog A-like [Phascolarctos cinereus]XP_020826081.1 protein unc-93 homolog A-like [Phascolarctos cinereus]XP_020826082.1 protein unc-93 homolog A-like [Phascolarctos cinereus]
MVNGFLINTMDRNLKNVVTIAFGFLFLFTAYKALQNLQSSLNKAEGLGVATLSVIYASVILSSMFLPPVLIKKFGCKWTITFSMCCYITFSLGNFYASWFTLIPAAIILGLGAAPLWSAEATYLTMTGNIYAKKTGKLGKDVINQYFGIFFLIFQTSGVWGNLISSLVFQQDPPKEGITEEQLRLCGANDCMTTSTATNSTKRPANELVYTLLGIYTGSGVLAVLLIAVFLDQLPNDSEETEKEKNAPIWTHFLATFQHLRDKRQCLLIPLTMYGGFEQAFISGDYTKSYVTCALGIHNVGFVMICFSGATSLCSLMFGKLSQYTGRKVLYAIGTTIQGSCMIFLLLWKPHPSQKIIFFFLAAFWGMGDAVFQTQNNALYGVLFVKNKEAAFANYRLWESLGYVFAFGYSTFLCVYIKLYIVLSVLTLSMVLYVTVEVLEYIKTPKASGSEEKESHEEEIDTQTKM